MVRFEQELTLAGETAFVMTVQCRDENYDSLIIKRKIKCQEEGIPYKIYQDGKLVEYESFNY